MPHYKLKKGLDLPILGAPDQQIYARDWPSSVAVLGADFPSLKPKMLVADGDEVQRGTPLFCDKDSPEVQFTAPATGTVRAVNRGYRRVLESVVIDVRDAEDPGIDFGALEPSAMGREGVTERLLASGLWAAFRTRPYSKTPQADASPAAIYVTAMDTEPLAPDVAVALGDGAADLALGLEALTHLTDGRVYLCQGEGASLAGRDVPGVDLHSFEGPHPAGLAGTHMHFVEPPSAEKTVWSIGYQDVREIGTLMRTGHLDGQRVVALTGPRAKQPRLVRTLLGASTAELTEGEIADPGILCRVISGSVLSGRAAEGPYAYLGRHARQVTMITEDHEQITLGWITPQPGKFAVQPVLASHFLGKKLFDLTSNLNGGRRAMVPTGTFERLMPQDFLPTQLLRALLVKDTDAAQALGALELDEEDLALCAFACPAKYEYGEALRKSLAKIEKEG